MPFCGKLDELLRSVFNNYSHSTQKREELENLCIANDDPAGKLAHLSFTRWLSKGTGYDTRVSKVDSTIEQH